MSALLNEVLQQQEMQAGGSRFYQTLEDAIAPLQARVDNYNTERIKVDQGEELEDLIPYYKSPDFNPNANIKVTFRHQAAADAGGVLRKLFTNVFETLQTKDEWFVGNPGHRLPSSNMSLIMSGMFEIIGNIISHAIVLSGGTCGPLLFSPAVYYYLSSGSLESSTYITIEDATALVKYYVEQVNYLLNTLRLDS